MLFSFIKNTLKHTKKLAFLGFATASSLPAIANAEECFFMQDKATGHYLDGNNSSIYTQNFNNGMYQRWSLIHTGDGKSVFLVNKATGKALDGNGKALYPHVPNGGAYQKWELVSSRDGGNLFYVRHQISGKVLDSNHAYNAYLFDYNGGDFQIWRFHSTSCN
ncbi:RICIN domain-containing protein [Fluviispira vulneris]|uniref:RICIN domain-containing protein n=1 Tax=Fluviispira vulneris TaxID=2763012 RepID=UPI0016440A4A|nr:RICIN domain-containing protein [Fluviispira vulneris]